MVFASVTGLPRPLKVLVLFCVDAGLASIAYWLATIARFGGIPSIPMHQVLLGTAIAAILAAPASFSGPEPGTIPGLGPETERTRLQPVGSGSVSSVRRTRRRSLPVGLRGRVSTRSTDLGHL